MSMYDKHSLIQRLKELSFPEGEYWVVAGGAMVLHGFEIFENWLEGTVEVISGVPVVSVDGLIQMKKKLGREKI